jgi:hypothetical protein
MGVITYVNGGRIQSCELIQEENVASSTRATADDLFNVKLDRELLGQGQCQAIYIGRSKTQNTGKTTYVSLILPKRFYDAVLNISIIKKRVMGNPVAGRKFFTNFSGEGISLVGIYRHATFLQMFEIMGTRLTTTQARSVAATSMLKLNIPEDQPTGLAHTRTTQQKIYATDLQEVGIANKMRAQKTVLEQEANILLPEDASHQVALEAQARENVLRAQEFQQAAWIDEDFKKFMTETMSRSRTRKIMALEQIRILISIYALDDPEFSSLFLAGDRCPSHLNRMAVHMERYLYR